jgi:hypothetical protein
VYGNQHPLWSASIPTFGLDLREILHFGSVSNQPTIFMIVIQKAYLLANTISTKLQVQDQSYPVGYK